MQSPSENTRRKVGSIELLRMISASTSMSAKTDVYMLVIQRSGASQIRQHGRSAHLKPGDLALCSAAEDYSVDLQACGELLLVLLPATELRAACPQLDRQTAVSLSNTRPLVAPLAFMAESYFQITQDLPPPAAAHAAQALIAAVAGCLLAQDEQPHVERTRLSQYHLRRIRQYALDNLGDTGLSVARVGAALGLSAAHIHRLFAEETQTFSTWLWESRLRACGQALRQQSMARMSISDIAFRHGFAHATHFSRAFRARFGMTASAWRKGA